MQVERALVCKGVRRRRLLVGRLPSGDSTRNCGKRATAPAARGHYPMEVVLCVADSSRGGAHGSFAEPFPGVRDIEVCVQRGSNVSATGGQRREGTHRTLREYPQSPP